MPSSVVANISYNLTERELIVVYVSGDVYKYKNVPEKVYKDFKASVSKGVFLNRTIKRFYEMEKVSD